MVKDTFSEGIWPDVTLKLQRDYMLIPCGMPSDKSGFRLR